MARIRNDAPAFEPRVGGVPSALLENPEEKIKELLAEIEDLKDQNKQLIRGVTPGAGSLTFRLSPQGGISVYGLQRMPVTLYRTAWLRLIEVTEDLKRFLHDPVVSEMASTGKGDTRYLDARAAQQRRAAEIAQGRSVPSASQTNPDAPSMVTRPVSVMDVH